jgi:hypothetical protein
MTGRILAAIACAKLLRRRNAGITKIWPYVSLLFQSYDGLVTHNVVLGKAINESGLAVMV